MTEGALRWQPASASLIADQVDAVTGLLGHPNLPVGIVPWTTPARFFPRHGFQVYDSDAVVLGTETATATLTGAADVAAYEELFASVEAVASFGEEARDHLARIAAEYRALAGER
ncbi:MAG: DUF5753 domain-containing protein [Sporichthyaceae bacterium]|nr:DUF5753 domain-containing protein [Sporichthyaceae bacterium]